MSLWVWITVNTSAPNFQYLPTQFATLDKRGQAMNSTSATSAIIFCCVGLTIGAGARAQERLFIPQPGMQFTNDFGRDAESLTTVTSINENAVSVDYSSSRGVSVRRDLLVADRQNASSYVLGYEAGMPTVIPGTTSLGISAVSPRGFCQSFRPMAELA